MKRFHKVVKRFIDIIFSVVGLLVALPIIGTMAVIIVRTSGGNAFFSQRRIGLKGKPFNLLKLRSMREIEGFDTTITTANDPRITKVGKFIRRTKIDELPQLWNVLKGEMSFVGPRPDVPELINTLSMKDQELLLSIRPGITGLASLKYRGEEEILSCSDQPAWLNNHVIFPDKLRLNKYYIDNQTVLMDLSILLQTVLGLGYKATPESMNQEFDLELANVVQQ